jgi:hypothetical protein
VLVEIYTLARVRYAAAGVLNLRERACQHAARRCLFARAVLCLLFRGLFTSALEGEIFVCQKNQKNKGILMCAVTPHFTFTWRTSAKGSPDHGSHLPRGPAPRHQRQRQRRRRARWEQQPQQDGGSNHKDIGCRLCRVGAVARRPLHRALGGQPTAVRGGACTR